MKKALFISLIVLLMIYYFIFQVDFSNEVNAERIRTYTVCETNENPQPDCNYYGNLNYDGEEAIQRAVLNASPGDIISVRAGTYVVNSNIDVDKSLTIAGPEWQGVTTAPTAILTAGESIGPNNCAFAIQDGNVTIRNLKVISFPDHAFGMQSGLSNITIEQNYTIGNQSAVLIPEGNSATNITIQNNIFTNANRAGIDIRSAVGQDVIIKNNVIYNNGEDGIVGYNGAQPFVKNNIIANNFGSGLRNNSGAQLVTSYNNLYGNGGGISGDTGSELDISTDPLFIDSENIINPDFQLQTNSPSIDSGDPTDPYFNEPEPNGGRINQGSFGNTMAAQISEEAAECIAPYPGMVITEDVTICRADDWDGLWDVEVDHLETAITIGASDLEITCEGGAGFSGARGKKGVGLLIDGRHNVTVKNCTFRQFNHGILVKNSTDVFFNNVTIKKNGRGVKFEKDSIGTLIDTRMNNNQIVDLAIYQSTVILEGLTDYNKKRELLSEIIDNRLRINIR